MVKPYGGTMNNTAADQGPLERQVRPEPGPADLMVECGCGIYWVSCGQSRVEGWTRQSVLDYGEVCAEIRTRELRGVLQELRARLHCDGRRPEECYEMSLIDDVLRA